jgi:uncharacterized coiled-coil protein SlyX
MIIPILTKDELRLKIDELEDAITMQCLHFEKDLDKLKILLEDFKKELGV